MGKLTYVRMHSSDIDIPRLTEVYASDEIARYLCIGEGYFRYVTSNDSIYFYKVYEGEELIGTAHLELQSDVLYIGILVLPEFQKRGLGTRIVRDIQNDIFGLGYKSIEIAVDERNPASLRLFMGAGFAFVSKEDGLMNFSYARE